MTAIEPEIDDDAISTIAERLERMEGEVAEVRHTVADLAQVVLADIKDRRGAAAAFTEPLSATPSPIPGTLDAANALRRPWLFTELLRDCGATVRMYANPRYRVRHSTQVMVLALVGALLVNYFVFNLLILYVPVLSEVIERLVDIVLAVLLYKVLIREVSRYRQMLAQLARPSRSWNNIPASLIHNDPDLAAVSRTESP